MTGRFEFEQYLGAGSAGENRLLAQYAVFSASYRHIRDIGAPKVVVCGKKGHAFGAESGRIGAVLLVGS